MSSILGRQETVERVLAQWAGQDADGMRNGQAVLFAPNPDLHVAGHVR